MRLLRCMSPLMAQSGHAGLRIAAAQNDRFCPLAYFLRANPRPVELSAVSRVARCGNVCQGSKGPPKRNHMPPPNQAQSLR
jgi:hypothetical protein